MDSNIVVAKEKTFTVDLPANVTNDVAQAARRIGALSATSTAGIPVIALDSPIDAVVRDWLNYDDVSAKINDSFWTNEIFIAQRSAYVQLLLQVIAGNDPTLITTIQTFFHITSAADFAGITDKQWRAFFTSNPTLLPAFTTPGNTSQRIESFIRYIQRFLTLQIDNAGNTTTQGLGGQPTFDIPSGDILRSFLDKYGAGFSFSNSPDNTSVDAAIATLFPNDPKSSSWLKAALETIHELFQVTKIAESSGAPPLTRAFQFSLMEALYARGFTSGNNIKELSITQFRQALAGTVAYDSSDLIWNAAGRADPSAGPEPGFGFQPSSHVS